MEKTSILTKSPDEARREFAKLIIEREKQSAARRQSAKAASKSAPKSPVPTGETSIAIPDAVRPLLEFFVRAASDSQLAQAVSEQAAAIERIAAQLESLQVNSAQAPLPTADAPAGSFRVEVAARDRNGRIAAVRVDGADVSAPGMKQH